MIFIWTQSHTVAFQRLKDALVNSDVLSFPRFDISFHIAVDTSTKGIGYMLYKLDDDDNTPCYSCDPHFDLFDEPSHNIKLQSGESLCAFLQDSHSDVNGEVNNGDTFPIS